MATNPADTQGPSDGELIEAVRHGSTEAYGLLYERHVDAAYNMARQVSTSASEADDLVSEAFAKMLDTLRAGRGPTTSFRAYLLTAVRHTAYDRTRRDSRVRFTGEFPNTPEISVPFVDTAVLDLERTLVAQAFARLPERWQTVLWHVEVEGQSPVQVAPILGLTPNGVSALAYRAREGLRQAYLQVHLGQLDTGTPGFQQCRATVDRLGAWTRGGLSRRETAQVDAHLDGCQRCRSLAAELADVNGALRGVIAPIVLGSTAVAGYLTSRTSLISASPAPPKKPTPRQTAATSMSCAALAVAVAMAMSAGPDAIRPTAAPPPPSSSELPATPPPPPTTEPAGPPPAPEPPPALTPPPPPPSTPTPPPPPPPPAVPALEATAPTDSLELVAGGESATLPITVRNVGTGTSEPIAVALSLPAGVNAGITGPMSAESGVLCAPGDAGLTCTSPAGLAPGESITLPFQVHADEAASAGEITANVSAGEQVNVAMPAVGVTIKPPVLSSGVDVEVSAEDGPPWLHGRIRLEVRNSGDLSGTAVATAEIPPEVKAIAIPPECQVEEQELRCSAELDPGESFEGQAWLSALPDFPNPETGPREVPITVDASLDDSEDSASTTVRLRFPLTAEHSCPQLPEMPDLPLDARLCLRELGRP